MFKLTLFLNFILPVVAWSQSIDEIKNQKDKYLYGFGEAESYELADDLALSNLVKQISVTVTVSDDFVRKDSNYVYSQYAQSVIKTYSSTSLTNAGRFEEKKNGMYQVVRYITVEDRDKIFKRREHAIKEYIEAGLKAEKKFELSDAIRNFYWANALLVSHPDYDSLFFMNNGEADLLKVFLPNKINQLLSGVDIDIVETVYDEEQKYARYTIELTYGGETVQSLDYSFKFKNAWSSTISANNGMASLEFYGDNAAQKKDISIRVEYRYEDKAYFDRDVQSVFSSGIYLPYFDRCEITTSLKKAKGDGHSGGIQMTPVNVFEANESYLKSNIEKLLSQVRKGRIEFDVDLFTPEGFEAYNKLIGYGNAKLLTSYNELKVVKVNDETIVRSIPMQFSFSNEKQFVEDVVFVFNDKNQLSDVSFTLGQRAIQDLLSREERFASEHDKYFLLRFMESYKTAYCLKRIDYLNNIFDDDALIIVGKVLKKKTNNDIGYRTLLSNDQVSYQKYSKKEYIKNLNRLFSRNEFVHIHFEDNIVKKAKKDLKVYGIQIAQHYTSSSYADKGYLFLMVDLRDTLNPVVHVRTWQPRKIEDGSIYGLSDFPIESL